MALQNVLPIPILQSVAHVWGRPLAQREASEPAAAWGEGGQGSGTAEVLLQA